MKKLPILIFLLLCLTAMATSCGSYRKAERNIENDLKQALAKTINEKGMETMRQDSIRAYRSIARTEGEMMTIAVGDETLRRHLRNPQLGEMAFITYTVRCESGGWKVTLDTEAKCSAVMIWSLSDQRLSAWLAVMALLSLALSFRGRRQSQPITKQEQNPKLAWVMPCKKEEDKVNRRQTESHQARLNGRGAKEEGKANLSRWIVSVPPVSLLCSASSWRCLLPPTLTVCQSMKYVMYYGQRRMMLTRHYMP